MTFDELMAEFTPSKPAELAQALAALDVAIRHVWAARQGAHGFGVDDYLDRAELCLHMACRRLQKGAE